MVDLEIEDKVNLTMLINKWKCNNILQNQEQKNLFKDMKFYHLQYKKQLLEAGLNAVKTGSKKVVHKTGEYLEIKLQMQ